MLFGGVLRVVAGIAQIIGGVGMLFMQKWGWGVALIATIVTLLDPLFGRFGGGLLGLFNLVGLPTYPSLYDKFLLVVSMVFNGVTIWYAWNWA